jgi:mannose/cellobiose epimerase-like protein (N-acyl-D-glucosamine 2-epimerase family)
MYHVDGSYTVDAGIDHDAFSDTYEAINDDMIDEMYKYEKDDEEGLYDWFSELSESYATLLQTKKVPFQRS